MKNYPLLCVLVTPNDISQTLKQYTKLVEVEEDNSFIHWFSEPGVITKLRQLYLKIQKLTGILTSENLYELAKIVLEAKKKNNDFINKIFMRLYAAFDEKRIAALRVLEERKEGEWRVRFFIKKCNPLKSYFIQENVLALCRIPPEYAMDMAILFTESGSILNEDSRLALCQFPQQISGINTWLAWIKTHYAFDYIFNRPRGFEMFQFYWNLILQNPLYGSEICDMVLFLRENETHISAKELMDRNKLLKYPAYIKYIMYGVEWLYRHKICSEENLEKLIGFKEDIHYLKKLDLGDRKKEDQDAELNQQIFDLTLKRMMKIKKDTVITGLKDKGSIIWRFFGNNHEKPLGKNNPLGEKKLLKEVFRFLGP